MYIKNKIVFIDVFWGMFMEKIFNLQKATKTISRRIIDSKNMLEAIEEIIEQKQFSSKASC